jgi:hypothetical protein
LVMTDRTPFQHPQSVHLVQCPAVIQPYLTWATVLLARELSTPLMKLFRSVSYYKNTP